MSGSGHSDAAAVESPVDLRIPVPPGGARGSLLEVPPSRWGDLLAPILDESYRADQIADWVYRHATFEFDAMTNLPASLRERLTRRCSVEPPSIDQAFTSVDGSRRYLLRLTDDRRVEAVYMPYDDRVTLCISSQVGCRFGCTFCQTGKMGLVRDLTVGEIVGQVLRLRSEEGLSRRAVNVVFMGQGEPLDNVEGVLGAVESLQDPHGADLSWRRITVSTVGVVPHVERLSELGDRRPRLAVSLNAPRDEVRSRIMPINRSYPIARLFDALRSLEWRKREQVTFEYVLLAGINDAPEDARQLAELVRGLPAKVNLIPWNPIAGASYSRPSPERIDAFRRASVEEGVDTLVRYSRGADIAAACGQLHSDAGESARESRVG